MTEIALPYNGLALDRAGGLRTDQEWVAAAIRHPDARLIPLWRDQCLVTGTPPREVVLPMSNADPVLAAAGEVVLLGREGDAGVFATDLSTVDQAEAVRLVGASGVLDVRRLFPMLPAEQAATLAYARGILHWNRNQRFCGACGSGTVGRHAGHLRVCLGCEKWLFPRIEPAVIVLVEAPGTPRRCLLGRHRGAAEGVYSTLAGFVEIGESLEDAVRREVAEESGVRVASATYQASQAWPFPAGLMVGFRARAASEEISVDQDELAEARWFTREELAERLAEYARQGIHRPDSIEQFLVDTWMRETAPGPES